MSSPEPQTLALLSPHVPPLGNNPGLIQVASGPGPGSLSFPHPSRPHRKKILEICPSWGACTSPPASCPPEAGAQKWLQVSQLHSSVTHAGHRSPQHLAGFVATGFHVIPEPMATPVAWLEAASLSTLPDSSPNLLHFLGERCPALSSCKISPA